MSLHAQYRKDKTTTWLAVTAGVELECSHFDPRSPEYQACMLKLTKPVRKIVEQGLLKPGEDRKFQVRAFVETSLKGWRTAVGNDQYRNEIEVTEGEWLPYSIDNAITVFAKYPQFYQDVWDMARELANFQVGEDERKN